MATINFNNYGMNLSIIGDLIDKYNGKEATEKNVNSLKEEIYDGFINNRFIDFSTKGNGAHILDVTNMTNCEIEILN